MIKYFFKNGKISQAGFTLFESMIVIGLTSLVAVGIVMGLMEGMNVLTDINDTWTVENGHQRVQSAFLGDVQSAVWFNNGEVHDNGGNIVLRDTPSATFIALGYPTDDGDEVWIRYQARPGTFSEETYLMRTIITASGVEEGSTILSTGIAKLDFLYFDENGAITDKISRIKRIRMTLSINVRGATVQREYEATLRNPNGGPHEIPGDFNNIETASFTK